MKFGEGPYSYQQHVSAMVPWRVGFKFYLRSTFAFVGQDAASERHHCRNTNVTNNLLGQVFRGQWRPRRLRFLSADRPPLADKVTIARQRDFFCKWEKKFRKIGDKEFLVYVDKFSTLDKISPRRQWGGTLTRLRSTFWYYLDSSLRGQYFGSTPKRSTLKCRTKQTVGNKMFLQWCRDELHLSFIFVQRFCFVGQDAASERHHCRNTNVGSNFCWTD